MPSFKQPARDPASPPVKQWEGAWEGQRHPHGPGASLPGRPRPKGSPKRLATWLPKSLPKCCPTLSRSLAQRAVQSIRAAFIWILGSFWAAFGQLLGSFWSDRLVVLLGSHLGTRLVCRALHLHLFMPGPSRRRPPLHPSTPTSISTFLAACLPAQGRHPSQGRAPPRAEHNFCDSATVKLPSMHLFSFRCRAPIIFRSPFCEN